jgi:hypothetical protein
MLSSNSGNAETALSQVLGHNGACSGTFLGQMLRHNGARVQRNSKRRINLRQCKAFRRYGMFLLENHGSDFTTME